jgi:anti-sigma-K factor RskA
VTDLTPEHAQFDELAAGYALDALDPQDELRFGEHAAECERCQATLAAYAEVTAALAASVPDGLPSAGLGERIMAAVRADPTRAAKDSPGQDGPDQNSPDQNGASRDGASRDGASPDGASRDGASRDGASPDGASRDVVSGPAAPTLAPVGDLAERRRRRRLVLAVTGIAAALLVAVGIAVGIRVAGQGTPVPVAGCAGLTRCHEVRLTASHSRRLAAEVIIVDRVAWLVPAGLRPDDPARDTYVLWQVRGLSAPVAVGRFDVAGGARAPVRIGRLAIPFSGTVAFAVSLEPGRTVPARPSAAVALGQVLP